MVLFERSPLYLALAAFIAVQACTQQTQPPEYRAGEDPFDYCKSAVESDLLPSGSGDSRVPLALPGSMKKQELLPSQRRSKSAPERSLALYGRQCVGLRHRSQPAMQ
jgi:hypothetical protein